MHMRNWLAVIVSIVLLSVVATAGVLVNGSALRAADKVHRDDTRELGVNNTTLAGQLQLTSAKELNDFAHSRTFALRPGDAGDLAALRRETATSDFFGYAVALTDITGKVLTATRQSGLPGSDDPGFAPLRADLLRGRPGFSAVMSQDGTPLFAVAVPIVAGGQPAGLLVGFTDLSTSQLQAYIARLSAPGETIDVVDSTGRVAGSSDAGQIGATVDKAIAARLSAPPADHFVDYRSGGIDMIAVVVGGIPGNWSYVRIQTKAAFDGPAHSRSRSTNITLLGMLLIGVAGVALLGYRMQRQRQQSEQRFRALFQHAPDVVAVLDSDGNAIYASPSATTLLGTPDRLLVGRSVFDFIHSEDRPRMQTQFGFLLENAEAVLREQCRILNSDGAFRWVEFTASNQLQNPSLRGIVVNARDITENRLFQDRLAHEAQHDPLTGLPNRRRMNDVLRILLRDRAVAVLFIDLDGFKPVNDSFGHEAGDDVLRQVAERVIRMLRPNEVLARVGGDEFIVLMPDVVRWFEAESLARRIREAIELPINVGGDEIEIGASIGVHVATPADNPDHVLRAADHAMYAIKKAGGGRRAGAEPVGAAATASTGRHRAADE
jgi:diguanylate cyclase (GGDEF)-like protein/PAS domain S-box-containing protein